MIQLAPYLKSHLNRLPGGNPYTDSRRSEALYRVISVLMQGIALHGLQYEEAAFSTFQNSVWKLRAAFELAQDEDSAMLLAGAAIRLLEEHNEAAETFIRSRQIEVGNVIGMLSETLLDVTEAAPQTIAQVRELEREIVQATSTPTLVAARVRLGTAMAEMKARTQLNPGRSTSGHLAASESDPVTGLPDAGCAVEELARIWPRRSDYYVGLFALEYLETINLRFGFKTGDELLVLLGQQAGQNFSSPDLLFRWRGPCLAALVERRVPKSMVATEFGRVIPQKLEYATVARERDAMVRVSTSWTMIRLSDAGSLDDAIARMNEFSGNRSRHVRQVAASS